MYRYLFNVISRLQGTTLKMSHPDDERGSCKAGPIEAYPYCRTPNRGLLLVMGATHLGRQGHGDGAGIDHWLNGRLATSSSTIELKASPVGSTPTWRST
jgi:hypothetical protein